jgi:hypothetical protein
MAKETGLGWTTLTVQNDALAAQDLRNDLTNLDFSTPYNTQEVTGIDKSAMERLLLLADFTGTLNSVFNPAANRVHDVFNGDLRIPRVMAIVISAQTLSNTVLFTDYALTRAAGGEFTAQHPFVLSNGTVPTWA